MTPSPSSGSPGAPNDPARLACAPVSPVLSYCTNVHPGETVDDLVALLGGPVARARRGRGRARMGAGLWLPLAAARAVAEDDRARDRVAAALELAGLFAFTANAFPIGGFHDPRVKERVYRPTWADPARRDFTLLACRALARLLPDGARGSVSTSPISFRPFGDEAEHARAGWHLGEVAAGLLALEAETGHEVALALEPEPGCTLETAAEAAAFLERHLLGGAGREALVGRTGLAPAAAEAALRRLVGVCVDACHLAVVEEPLVVALERLARAGLRVVKAQLSSALELDRPGDRPAACARLAAFAEPRFLHQTTARLDDGRLVALPDLSAALGPDGALLDPALSRARRLRTHFHVPLAWEGDEHLATTRGWLEAGLAALARATDHLEVETYTFDVLPAADRARWGFDVAAMCEAELRWAEAALAARGVATR